MRRESADRAKSRPSALILLLLGILVPYAWQPLARYRLVRPGDLHRSLAGFTSAPRAPFFELEKEPPAAAPPRPLPKQTERASEPAPRPRPAPRVRRRTIPLPEPPPIPIEDPTHDLARFFGRLAATLRGEPGAITRISHFGDSPLTGDLISGEARSLLQREFGDSGPGFTLIARPWGWYGHQGLSLSSSGWRVRSPLLGNSGNGRHGLSGISFTAAASGAKARIEIEESSASKLDVTFLREPTGGRFSVVVEDNEARHLATEVSTRGPSGPSLATLRVVDSAHTITLRPLGDGPVTLFGIALERTRPGLVYDAIGANGGSVHFLTLLDGESWQEDLKNRASDLVILNYGTNESGYAGIPGPRYERDYATVIERIRAALPNGSILIMAPMDRGMRAESGEAITMPTIPRIVAAQRRIAQDNACAFFNTFEAMGGEGTMALWYDAEPRLVSGDFTHTTKQGSDRVARLLVGAIRQAFEGYRSGERPPR